MPGAGGQPPQRTTFRPPWVKDGPSPLPMPSAPWALNSRRDSKPKVEEPPPFTQVTLKVSSFLSFSHSPISCHTRVRYLKSDENLFFVLIVFGDISKGRCDNNCLLKQHNLNLFVYNRFVYFLLYLFTLIRISRCLEILTHCLIRCVLVLLETSKDARAVFFHSDIRFQSHQRDFTINNSRGCHVTSSCVINISTSRRLQMRCVFELYLIERLLLLLL